MRTKTVEGDLLKKMLNESFGCDKIAKGAGSKRKLAVFCTFFFVLSVVFVQASFFDDVFTFFFGDGSSVNVKMLENTDSCLTDCYTVYEVSSPNKKIDLSIGKNLSFQFRNKKSSVLQSSVNGLERYEVLYNTTAFSDKWCVNDNTYSCNVNDNGTMRVTTCSNGTRYKCGVESKESFVKLQNNDVLSLKKGDSVKIKISGRKKLNADIDNVLSLDFEGAKKDFEEWAWWNFDWNNCKNININISRPFEPIIINVTAITINASGKDIRIINQSCGDGGVQTNFSIFDTGSNYANIGFINYDNTKNYSIYYNNPAAIAANKTIFLFADNFNRPDSNVVGDMSGGSNKWGERESGAANVNITNNRLVVKESTFGKGVFMNSTQNYGGIVYWGFRFAFDAGGGNLGDDTFSFFTGTNTTATNIYGIGINTGVGRQLWHNPSDVKTLIGNEFANNITMINQSFLITRNYDTDNVVIYRNNTVLTDTTHTTNNR